jgi:hypothetical protein
MKRADKRSASNGDRDTLRPEYDFRNAVRGLTAARFAEGANVVVIAREVRDVFPDAVSVNEALRALAPLLRGPRRPHGGRSLRNPRRPGALRTASR